jgi:hypothetical protein
MWAVMRSPFTLGGMAVLAAALVLPLPARAGQASPVLVAGAAGTRVEMPSGQVVAPRLPAGARLETVAGLGAGWLAAGTRPVASGGSEILLLAGEGETVSPLPAPPGRTAQLRREPLPLVDGDRLAGLAWLEGAGPRALAVRFAPWNGAGWGEPETVSPPGPGSQLALAAARLGDGSWLLAWSAFDGHDDEIVWSRRGAGAADAAGTTWSRPRRVAADDEVPDITPALVATPGGALLAWSRFDGEGYRVVVARFRDGRWEAPRTVGPEGSLFPSFEPGTATGARLLFRTAAPAGWSVLDLDAAGRPRRSAAVPSADDARPVVRDAGPAALSFRWPASGVERAAAWEAKP